MAGSRLGAGSGCGKRGAVLVARLGAFRHSVFLRLDPRSVFLRLEHAPKQRLQLSLLGGVEPSHERLERLLQF